MFVPMAAMLTRTSLPQGLLSCLRQLSSVAGDSLKQELAARIPVEQVRVLKQ